MLATVDDPVIAVAVRTRGHAAYVRTAARLGHREAVVTLAADRGKQVTLDLVTRACLENVAGPRDEHLQCVAGTPELTLGECEPDGIEATTAELGRHVGGVETSSQRLGADRLDDGHGDLVEALDLVLVGVELGLDEIAYGLDDRPLLVGECEVHVDPLGSCWMVMGDAVAGLARD